ncbi:hypothetical protein LSCM1_01365 [Leishmania martiniquensis]|uniref:Protein kinase domain-containing protein n=1 Tax=Leishmania martiniquensis TaxID=1580590 RepID=A0A836KES5_9TRYP|nr:hypothetical protein LSCM1_01365 [Leishmania martiniquensis]
MTKAAATTTSLSGSVVSTIVQRRHDESPSLSSVLSGGPSPSPERSDKTRKHRPPLSSSAYMSCRRSSADSEPHEGRSLSPVRRSVHMAVMSPSHSAGLVRSQRSYCGSLQSPSRASERMPTEHRMVPSPLGGMARAADVSIRLEDVFSEAADLRATRSAAAATPCALPQLTDANRPRTPQAVPSSAATAVTPLLVTNQTNFAGAGARLGDSIQHGTDRGGVYAHPPHFLPLSNSSFVSDTSSLGEEEKGASEGHRLATPAHRRPEQCPLMAVSSLDVRTVSIPPASTADAAVSNDFGGGNALFQPPAHPPSLCSPFIGTAVASSSHPDLVTSNFTEADTPYQQPRQQQQLRLPFQQTNDLPAASRTAVADHSSLGSSIHSLHREATAAFDGECAAAAAAATEPRSGTAPFFSVASCASTATVGPTPETETQAFPVLSLMTTSDPLPASRASPSTEARFAVGARTPRRSLAVSEETAWHSPSYSAWYTIASPQKIEATVDEARQPTDGCSGRATDYPCHDLDNSPHTTRGLSALRGTSRSLSVSSSFSRRYPLSFAGDRSAPASEPDEAATALSVAAVQPEESDCCETPPSPHTPLTNRTPGPAGLHDSCTAHHSPGHSHSRYRSQLLSQSLTPQKSGHRAFSRQTTPSQSFRSKVQSHTFESQQPHQYATQHISSLMRSDTQSNTYRFLVNGESTGVAERDYLAPSRNPYSLYRTLEPYITDLSALTPSAAPGSSGSSSSSTPDLLLAHDLPEPLTAFAAALEKAFVRPDAAVILYAQLVPSPLHSSGIWNRAQLGKSAAYGSFAAPQDLAAERSLSIASLALSSRCRGGEHGRTLSALLEEGTATTPTGATTVVNRRGRCLTLATTRNTSGQSPTRVRHMDLQSDTAPTSSSTPVATHVSSTGNFPLPERIPLAAQSLSCNRMQPPMALPPSSAAASCNAAPASPTEAGASPGSVDEPPGAVTAASTWRQPAWRESAESGHASPPPRRPLKNPAAMAPSCESKAGCRTLCAKRALNFEVGVGDKEAACGGCEGVHARGPLDLRAEGSGSAWSSYGSPNCLCRTVAHLGPSGSGLESPVKALGAALLPPTPPVQPAPEHEAAPAAHGREERAAAFRASPLDLSRWANQTSRLQLLTPTLQWCRSPGREVPGLRISTESSWIRGPLTPVVTGVGLPARSFDYADVSAGPQVGYDWAESFSEPLETTDMSEEGIPGDRFQAHHAFQFLHSIAPACGGSDVEAGRRGESRQAIPLCVEVNGVTWLAVHRLNGLPYALKEVPTAAFNLAELRCLTLSVAPPSTRATAGSAACGKLPEQHAAGLTGEDRLEAEDCIARYYSVSTPPQSSVSPEVHLLQLEYFPRGSLSELARRRSGQHATFSADELPSLEVGARALSSRFWLEAVTQGLRGLRVLHRADLIHGCPLPLSLFLCGSAPSTVRFKWSCFGNARADADIYPTESLPTWAHEAVTRLYQMAAFDGSTVAPDVVEVAVFCVGMLEMLAKQVYAHLSSVLPPGDSPHLNELEWIEAVVMHPSLHLYVGDKEGGENMHAVARLMRFLWDVSTSYRTADQVLAQLCVRVDPAARVVEQLYECELARLARQLEERRRRLRRRQQRGPLPPLPSANSASPSPTDAILLRSPAKTSVASASSRRQVAVSDSPSSPLHPATDPAATHASFSSRGSASPLGKSCNGSPQLFCSARRPPPHTPLRLPFTMPSKLLLPPSTAAAPAAAASVLIASRRVEQTASDLSARRHYGGSAGCRRASVVHPRILEAAGRMLERAVSAGDGASDAMTAILRPAVDSMCQRGWTTLYAGVPLAVTGGLNGDASAGTREAVEALMRSLRPLTSFE